MANNKNASESNNRDKNNKDANLKTAADFEQTAREAEQEKGNLKPGQTQGSNSKQHNNGRGGGK